MVAVTGSDSSMTIHFSQQYTFHRSVPHLHDNLEHWPKKQNASGSPGLAYIPLVEAMECALTPPL